MSDARLFPNNATDAPGGADVATGDDDLEWFEGWEDGAAVLAFLRATPPPPLARG